MTRSCFQYVKFIKFESNSQRLAPLHCIHTGVTGNQEYIKIGNEATSKIATIVHQKR